MKNKFKNISKSLLGRPIFTSFSLCLSLAILSTGCGGGGTGTGNPGNVALKSGPLAGSAAAYLNSPGGHTGLWLSELFEQALGIAQAHAAVSSFTSFKICNDTLVMKDTSGADVLINGSSSGAGLGLVSFSPTASTAMALESVNIATGVQIKEIDFTSAEKPDSCAGATYAVSFDPGSGPILITQNTSFKFQFTNPIVITGSSQTLTVLLGQIVNGMVGLGTGLNNSTIQTVNVGQAQ